MKYKIIAALLVALLMLTLTACGSTPAPAAPAQEDVPGQQTDDSADADAPAEDTADDADTAGDEDAWKVEFEKSLLDNYNVTPDHYEELEGGVYQVYVEMDGKVIPFVVVDPATGDYHG